MLGVRDPFQSIRIEMSCPTVVKISRDLEYGPRSYPKVWNLMSPPPCRGICFHQNMNPFHKSMESGIPAALQGHFFASVEQLFCYKESKRELTGRCHMHSQESYKVIDRYEFAEIAQINEHRTNPSKPYLFARHRIKPYQHILTKQLHYKTNQHLRTRMHSSK